MTTTNTLTFPMLELTSWIFDFEKVFFGYVHWDPVHSVKENDLEKHYNRVLVDAEGNIVNVVLDKIIKKRNSWLSASGIVQPTLILEFGLKHTGLRISMNDLKKLVLSRKDELFHIAYNRLMTVEDFEKKVNDTTDFKELIAVASFGLD